MSWLRGPVGGLGEYIGFVPGLLLTIVVAVIFGGRLATRLRAPRVVGILGIASVGIVLAATVTPGREAILGVPQIASGCDVARIGLADWSVYREINETSLNVLLFVPLGASIGLLPASPLRGPLLLAGLVLPFAIEILQLLATPLGRACQTGDIVDNVVGLVIGLAGAGVAAWLWRARHPDTRA